MRRPTDRAEAWEAWRRRLAGEHVEIGDAPMCGWYKAKRHGQWIAVQIDLHQVLDGDGYLAEPEAFVAFLGADTVIYEPAKVGEIWLRCAGNPISEEEAERLLRMPSVADLSRQVIT